MPHKMNPSKESKKSKFFLSKNSFRRNQGSMEELRKTSKKDLDTQSEAGFKLSNFSIQRRLSSFYDRRRFHTSSSSVNINNQPSPNGVALENLKPLEGVMFFINDSKGVCGRLSICKKRGILQFTSLAMDSESPSTTPKKNDFVLKKMLAKSPIDEMNGDYYAIDIFNILDIEKEVHKETHDYILHIFCSNFRFAKFMIRPSENAEVFVQAIMNISAENKRLVNSSELFVSFTSMMFKSFKCCLWQYLHKTYSYATLTDWKKNEASWYIENYRTRFCLNEVFLMNTLPQAMIVPAKLSEIEVSKIVSLSVGGRIPVISYLHRASNHFLIRSTTFGERDTAHSLLSKCITPLTEVNIDEVLPPLAKVCKYYRQIRKQCFLMTKQNNNTSLAKQYRVNDSKNFWSLCSNWFVLIAKTLALLRKSVNIIVNEASLVLAETNDIHWNCLLSSLVQIIIDPNRRTIEGFECLLSKEWIYLAGYKTSLDNNKHVKMVNAPNVALFHLFLDCVHQLIVHNPTSFQFSTFYLLSLVDVQFQADSYNREKMKQFEADKEHSLMRNPFFSPDDNDETPLLLKTSLHNVQFFYALFFRHTKSEVGKYTFEEHLYLMELRSHGHL